MADGIPPSGGQMNNRIGKMLPLFFCCSLKANFKTEIQPRNLQDPPIDASLI